MCGTQMLVKAFGMDSQLKDLKDLVEAKKTLHLEWDVLFSDLVIKAPPHLVLE